jgi:hypothetical protein
MLNFSSSIKAARTDLERSASLRHQYRRDPQSTLGLICNSGMQLESMRQDLARTRDNLRAPEASSRLLAFLLLIDEWRTEDALTVCLEKAFLDDDFNVRGFAVEKICRHPGFADEITTRHRIAAIINCPTNDDTLVSAVVETWVNAVSAYVSAESILQSLKSDTIGSSPRLQNELLSSLERNLNMGKPN